jgi:hypothetical protein
MLKIESEYDFLDFYFESNEVSSSYGSWKNFYDVSVTATGPVVGLQLRLGSFIGRVKDSQI